MSWRRRVGKIQKRLEDVKTRWTRPTRMDFSHNESIRLATDALVNGGLESYQETLGEEGEVDFLSSAEACYIQENISQPNGAPQSPGGEWLDLQESDVDSLQSGTYFPQFSGGGEPDLGDAGKPYLKEKSSVTVYFQTDRHSNIRDLIRRCIGKTNQVLAILMDEFTDIEIFCDVLEAANKRGVFVYILLDQRGVKLFNEMCNRAQILEIHLKNICIRSVAGEVYCAKSGRKFSGRIQEKFIISDWRCVLSGSYSLTWLSGQVHRNSLSKFSGQAVELFDEEFRHLYAISKPVVGFRSPGPAGPFQSGAEKYLSLGCPADSSSSQSSSHTPSDPFSHPSTGSHHFPKLSSHPPLGRIDQFPLRLPPCSPQCSLMGLSPSPYIANFPSALYSQLNVYRTQRTCLPGEVGIELGLISGCRPFIWPRLILQ